MFLVKATSLIRGAKIIVIGLALLTTVESTNTDTYNFPMMGVLMYDRKPTGPYEYPDLVAYGSVTIAHRKVVLAAAENLMQSAPDTRYTSTFIFSHPEIIHLYVFAGTDLLTPATNFEEEKLQRKQVDEIWFSKNSSFTWFITNNTVLYPTALKLFLEKYSEAPVLSTEIAVSGGKIPKDFIFNPFGELQWDVAIIILKDAFKWSPYVLPISFHWKPETLSSQWSEAWNRIDRIEHYPQDYLPCVVPGWSSVGNNEIVYHKVVYVRFKECSEAICGAYPATCLRYLNERQHICFKSLSYYDSCVLDQGAPVICPWSKNNIMGILVKTFDCGSELLPSVFTRTETITVFSVLAEISVYRDVKEPRLDDPMYTEKSIKKRK